MRVPARWAGLGAPLALWAGPLVWKLEQHLSPARSNTLRCLRIECLSVGIRPIFPDCACLSINFSRPRYWFTRRRGQGVEIVQESPHLVPLGADLPAEDDLSPVVPYERSQLLAMLVSAHELNAELLLVESTWDS